MDPNKSGLNRKNQPIVSLEHPMKITGLDDHCLEKIFDYLDSGSLANVAIANEWLRPAASVIYKKFGTKQTFLKNHFYMGFGLRLNVSNNQISVNGLKMCLQFLRCLGREIDHLAIWYNGWNKKQSEYLHRYINKYCAGSLVSIEVWHKPNTISIDNFDKPFVNVQTLKVYWSDLSNQFPLFQQWFPNIRSLKLVNVYTHCCIDSSFQHLEDLSVTIENQENGVTIAMATCLLQLHPQLHSIDINVPNDRGFTLKTLLNVIKGNSAVNNLRVTTSWINSDVSSLQIQQFTCEHPLTKVLDLTDYKFTAKNAMALINQLNLLKKFHFGITDRSNYNRLVSQLDSEWQTSLHDSFEDFYVDMER